MTGYLKGYPMNYPKFWIIVLCVVLGLLESACKPPESNAKAEAPPALKVQSVEDRNVFEVDRPERFQMTTAVPHRAVS